MAQIATLDLPDADATQHLGESFADLVTAGDVLMLEGPIGAGKTHFARSLIQARLARLDRHEDVPSPTFTLVQIYDAEPEIWHADLYRLTHPDEVVELGLEAAFETAICLIEWPDRLAGLAPATALTLRFEQSRDGAARRVTLSGGPEWALRLARIGGA
ncbi:MAG: tRNA (adenosine(37)-N6)-threonylcarbamoyltransferase complex ATPase subunit type 1 TsaE [Sphingomonadales bacterium]|nr:tRNA (adenosine(37)-N6)-threonylcarbamoyltransferase complex ATPase subunit type 1 TsaE [Sphingomonadales bacterium]